jgi:hypothetical protein
VKKDLTNLEQGFAKLKADMKGTRPKTEPSAEVAVPPDPKAVLRVGTEKIDEWLADQIDFVPWRQTAASISSTKAPNIAMGDL